MDDSPSKGELTRQALVDAAYKQFTIRGFHGASMRSIAQEAGLVVGGIYNHFSGKDEIFKEVVLTHHPLMRMLPQLQQIEAETAEEWLRQLAARIVAELERDPRMFHLLLIEMVECQGRHLPELMEEILPRLQGILQRVATLDDALQSTSPLALAQVFIGSVFAYWFTGIMLRQAGAPAEALADSDQFINVLLNGLLPHRLD